MKRVGIVICNYNKKEMVCNLIQSVLEMKYDSYDIYVADNASTDGSVNEILNRYADKVTIVHNKENLGGSGGFNAGLRKAMQHSPFYEYLWCLDNDVLVDENCLGALVDFLDSHADVGMVGSKVDHMEAPDYVQQFGMLVDFEQFATVPLYRNHVEDGTLPKETYSDAVPACSVLVRRSVIDKIGTLPEDNFLYWDDTEWGYKCNLAGFKVASCGDSIALHCMGAKKESENTFPTYYAWRNWIDFFARYTPLEKLEKMCLSFLQDIFDIVYCGLYNGEKAKARTVMLAYDDALHLIRGKAKEGRIFPMDKKTDKLEKLLQGKKSAAILMNNYKGAADSLADKMDKLFPEMEIHLYEDEKAYQQDKSCDIVFCMCNYIFTCKDLMGQYVFADQEGNLYVESEDELMVFNYPYSRKAFLEAQLPLFLDRVNEIRKNRPVEL